MLTAVNRENGVIDAALVLVQSEGLDQPLIWTMRRAERKEAVL